MPTPGPGARRSVEGLVTLAECDQQLAVARKEFATIGAKVQTQKAAAASHTAAVKALEVQMAEVAQQVMEEFGGQGGFDLDAELAAIRAAPCTTTALLDTSDAGVESGDSRDLLHEFDDFDDFEDAVEEEEEEQKEDTLSPKPQGRSKERYYTAWRAVFGKEQLTSIRMGGVPRGNCWCPPYGPWCPRLEVPPFAS